MKKLKTNTQTKQRLVTLLILVLIMVILSCISNKYLTVNNLINIVRQESTLIIIACAATMLMISGGMDLSPAGVIALTSVVFAKLCVSGISIPLAALLSLLVGVAAGTFSGLLVVLANVPPMIATLGTWYITKGLAYAISNSYAIVQGLPANFGWVNRYVGPFPLMVVIAVAVFAVFYILLNRTLLGKYAYAIGGNSETARLSGIKVNLVRCVLYILTALMSSFVGILMSSRINSGDPNLSTSGIEFEIIVAINKIDKPSANVERVKQELSEYELIPEDWGGSTIFVPVSAHTGEGIDNLLEMILLSAEVLELKANPNRAARGLVIEAQLDKGKGPVATILVQKGTLHVGDFIAAGACSGKVRAMMDDRGRRVKEAGPSTPVEILGLSDVPNAGEILMAFPSDKEAKNFAAAFVTENKKHLLEETKGKLSLDNLFDQIQASDLKELPLIIKADVQGSVEAVKQSLTKLSNEEVVVRVIHGGVGAVNESDVSLAATSNAIIIGFNVRPDPMAKQLADQEGVDLRLYKVIYQAIEDVEAAMKGMLDPVFEEKVIGHAEVRQLFKASGVGTIAGSYILDGIFQRNCKVRITREGEQVFEGELASLKRFKDDVKEVKTGYECGLVFDGFNDVKEEDKVEAYIMVEVPR